MANEIAQVFTFRVDIKFDQKARTLIAEDVIDFILRRTERGLDKNNKSFPKYSKSYSESLDFEIAGKSRNHVDLQLSGDMLTNLEVINVSIAGFITVGFKGGSEENNRAAWQRNNLRPDFPKRDFLGITDKDLRFITNRYTDLLQQQVTQERDLRDRIQQEADRILRGFGFSGGN
jgi:hypothetical protein